MSWSNEESFMLILIAQQIHTHAHDVRLLINSLTSHCNKWEKIYCQQAEATTRGCRVFTVKRLTKSKLNFSFNDSSRNLFPWKLKNSGAREKRQRKRKTLKRLKFKFMLVMCLSSSSFLWIYFCNLCYWLCFCGQFHTKYFPHKLSSPAE